MGPTSVCLEGWRPDLAAASCRVHYVRFRGHDSLKADPSDDEEIIIMASRRITEQSVTDETERGTSSDEQFPLASGWSAEGNPCSLYSSELSPQ